MKLYLILAILCCSVWNIFAGLENLMNMVPKGVQDAIIDNGLSALGPIGAPMGKAIYKGGEALLKGEGLSGAANAALVSGASSINSHAETAIDVYNLAKAIYEKKPITEAFMEHGRKIVESKVPGGAAVMTGLTAASKYYNNEASVQSIVSEMGQDTFEKYVPHGKEIYTGMKAANKLRNGEDPMNVLNEAGKDVVLKYVPKGEQIWTGVQFANAVRNGDPPEKILNELGKDAIIKYIPQGESIAKAIEVGQDLKTMDKKDLLDKYGKDVIDKYGGSNNTVGNMLKQAIDMIPKSAALVGPDPDVKNTPAQETKSENKGNASKESASTNKGSTSKGSSSNGSTKKGSTTKPIESKKPPTPSKSSSTTKTNSKTWISNSREQLERSADKEAKKKCWISHPEQKRRQQEEKKKKSIMSKIKSLRN